jgi:small subunit ribosomal protein S16
LIQKMAVKMRLTRVGAKGKPSYRVVVANSKSPRDGKFLEILGNYDPNQNPAEVVLKEERIRQWLAKGAKPTLTVSQLLEKKGIRV